ncbi:disintegrin and metalloproteinase [Lynx pardinus]|uniref:Disintegrin and metalloproteinase n=1 Tax=Lynx pardinus TaxID=191816 RepID=A0A485NGZ9_LYNPA|nr:disintegrin and metalloproteinase [Lynx pardinus]
MHVHVGAWVPGRTRLECARRRRWKVLWEPHGVTCHIRAGQLLAALFATYPYASPLILLSRLSFFFHRGLIANSFTETHYLLDGTDVSLTRNYTGHCYYHGHVQGSSGSTASLSTCSGLRGLITFENNTYLLEPMKNETNEYKLFPVENLRGTWGSCGSHHGTSAPAAETRLPPPSQMWARRHKRETLKMTKYVELVIVADNREVRAL